MNIQDHRDINQNREDNTKYASNFSDFATRYFSHALWLNDKGFSKTPLSTTITSSMINNNREFAKLDKNLGVNRSLTSNEYDLAMELAYRYSKENNVPYAQAINLFMLAAKTNVDKSQKEAFDHTVSTIESADEVGAPRYSMVFDRDKIDEAYDILATTAKERNLYFTDVYKEGMTSYPLYTATKEQYEDKDWNPEHTIGLGDTSDILIPFTKPAVGATKQLSSALYSSSKNAIKAPFVEMQARINEKLLANTPKGGKFGSDGILRHTESALKVSVVSKNGIVISNFTKHGVELAINRNVKSDDILDALKNPLKIKDIKIDEMGRQSQRFIGENAEVVVNPNNGKIISVNPTSSAKARQLLNKEK